MSKSRLRGLCHGCVWELGFEAVLPKAFLGWDIPSCVRVTEGQDTWQGSLGCVPAVSCLAGSSICSCAPWREKPWDKVWEEQAGCVLCDCRCCRKLGVSVSIKPARGCFYGSTGQQEETKPLGVPSFLTGLLGTC